MQNIGRILILFCMVSVIALPVSFAAGDDSYTFVLNSPSQKVTVASYFVKTRAQLHRVREKFRGLSKSQDKAHVVVLNGESLSADGTLAVAEVIGDREVERVNLTVPSTFGRLRANWTDQKSLIAMTVVTSVATAGATTTALICGENVSASTAIIVGTLWGAVAGGYVYNNERMQAWLRRSSFLEDRIIQTFNIRHPTLLNHLKVTGEWTKYFLHVAGWNAFGAMASAALESDFKITASTVLATSVAELFAVAPVALAIASDTERAKARNPQRMRHIQLLSTFGLMATELTSEVLSVLALTGTYNTSLGFGVMAAGGGLYYAKTFMQDFLARRSARQSVSACEELLTSGSLTDHPR